IENTVRVLEGECDQTAAHAGLALPAKRLASDEAPRLIPGDRKGEAGLEGGVLIADVVAPMTVRLFHPEAFERVIAGEAQPKRLTGLDDRVVHRLCELSGDIELVPQLADVSDAAGADPRVAEVDEARGGERKGGCRQVGIGKRREQLAAARPHET